LVTGGNHQQAGIDYHDNFTPIIHPASVRLILYLAATHNGLFVKLDVKNVFLHGILTETIYMR